MANLKRIYPLPEAEIAGQFSINMNNSSILNSRQLAYFKAKNQFFTFTFNDVSEDVELVERAERRGDHKQAEQIKRVSPVSWKHVNFYGQYDFLDAAGTIDLSAIVDWLEEFSRRGKTAN